MFSPYCLVPMAKCRWCEKSLPGDVIPACNSCFFTSREEADPSNDDQPSPVVVSDELANYDLSGLGREREQQYAKGKSKHDVKSTLFTKTAFKEQSRTNQEIPMKRVKVKSNSIRSRIFIVDNLVLNFDENGIAEIDEAYVPIIIAYSRIRPNRLSVVPEPEVAPAPAPAPKKVEPKAAPEKPKAAPEKSKEKKKAESNKVTESPKKAEPSEEDSE